jgi:hypothetical protein
MWDRLWVSVWYALIGLFVVYELYSLLDGRDQTPPLTHVLVREVPWWVTLPFLVWLLLHFVEAYGKHLGWWR